MPASHKMLKCLTILVPVFQRQSGLIGAAREQVHFGLKTIEHVSGLRDAVTVAEVLGYLQLRLQSLDGCTQGAEALDPPVLSVAAINVRQAFKKELAVGVIGGPVERAQEIHPEKADDI